MGMELEQLLQSLLASRAAYAKRIKQIEKIEDTLTDDIADDIDKVNRHMTSCREHLEAGIKGAAGVSAILSTLDEAREKNVSSDTDLRRVKQHLDDEIIRCNEKINELDSEISAVYDRIAQRQSEGSENSQ